MKAILEYLQNQFTQLGYYGIAGYITGIIALLGILQILWRLVIKLLQIKRQRKLKRDLHPFYTQIEIKRATQYYVETTCQNIAPSKEEEPKRTHAFATREKIIPFFLKKAFKPDKNDCQFYIILADSGMGKTTFLINLYLRYCSQFIKPPYKIRLFPLGFPDIDKEIDRISDEEKRNTILLLDAFDEDINALPNYKKRLNDLIHKIVRFREVVITCRTQFFPSEEEEPKETGVLRFGGEGGHREFRKLYLSPFDDKDISAYLRKRFAWFQVLKKCKAWQIVKYSPNLMVRPMLLSYIDNLLEGQHNYTAAYMVYEELIARWIDREARRVSSERYSGYKEELCRFSREIALDIYRNRTERNGSLLINSEEIKPFAEKHHIVLEEMEMKARSLLNRNARGEYKFSHKSVLEYFLAKEAFDNEAFRKELSFDGLDQAEAFFNEIIGEKLTIPFLNRTDLNVHYSFDESNPKKTTRIDHNILKEITFLSITGWKPADGKLLFRGIKKLKRLEIIGDQFTREQREELQHFLPECKIEKKIDIIQVSHIVYENEAKEVFKLNENMRPREYIQNDFEDKGEVVIDHATGLMWQKSGSDNILTYDKAQKYVKKLNKDRFAGYNDWRLPTIPELMSLMETEKQSNGLYINPMFDSKQTWCWSADLRTGSAKSSSGSAWSVNFYGGNVSWGYLYLNDIYVRVVRSWQ